jgi:GNAT superfamily N-acetyltransferase
MTVTLRPMFPEDAPGVGVMHHQAWVDTYGAALPADYFATWTVDDAIRRWRDLLAAATPVGATRLVAVDPHDEGGTICGLVAAGPSRDPDGRPEHTRPSELWALYVAATRLGTGLGQRLLDAVLERHEPAELWVFRDNPRARAFYVRNGFTPDGATFVDDRFPDLPEIRMVR